MKYILSLICTSFLCLNLAYSQVQIVASNIGNNFSITYPANLGSPVTIPSGLMITFKSISSISGISTLSINGSAAKTIKKQVSLDLQSGDILNGQFVTVIYDGTFFQMLSASPSATGSSWLIGGNSISGTNTLGTLNANDIVLITNNLERMRISSSTGYVGIGTTAPSMPFHVASDIGTDPNVGPFNGSALFENTLLSNNSIIGVGFYSKSIANEYGVGGVVEGGQMGLYAISQITGSGIGTRIGLQARAKGGTKGIGIDANAFGNANAMGARLVGQSSIGVAKGLDARGTTDSGDAYGIVAQGYSGNGISYGGEFTSNSTDSISYGVKSTTRSENEIAYGIHSVSSTQNGYLSYGNYIQNSVNNGTGTSYGSYIYNSGSGASYGTFITNYGGTGYTSIGLYSGAFGGSSNYSGYFAAGDVFVNDKIGVGTNNPSERITVENTSYGITHRDGASVTMSTYIGNSYTPLFIPGASIGTQSDHPFFIYINNSGEKFYIGNSAQNYNVGIGTSSPGAKLEVNGFTKLGSNAPAIKNLFLTTTSPTAQGGVISIAHGLTDADILSVNVLVEYANGYFVPNAYTRNPGYQFDFYFGGGVINIYNSAANSASILSRPVKIFITYQ